MAGARGPAACLLAGAVSVLALVGHPSPVVSADDGAVVIGGATMLARTIDLTGDGAREVVRVATDGRGEEPAFLEAWGHEDGGWRALGRVPLDVGGADGERRPMRAFDPVALLPWRHADATSLLLLGGSGRRHDGGLDRLEVAVVRFDGGRLGVTPVGGVDGGVARLDVADLDADGTDEIVATDSAPEGPSRVQILSWTGRSFAGEPFILPEGSAMVEPIIGEADGMPGDDVVLGIGDGRELVRLVLDGGEVAIERVSLDEIRSSAVRVVAWPIAAGDGAVFLHAQSRNEEPRVVRLDWPRGGTAEVTARADDGRHSPFLQPMHAGEDVYFVGDEGFGLFGPTGIGAVIRDARFEVVAEVSAGAAVRRALDTWLAEAPDLSPGFGGPFPYSGVVPDGHRGGVPAFITSGNLLIFEDGDIDVRPTATFIGVAPVGMAGHGDAWLALTRGVPVFDRSAYFYGFPPVDDGLVLVPASRAFAPEEDGGELAVEYRGAVPVVAGESWVASADGGFEVVVHGVPGSRVATLVSGLVAAEATIDDRGQAVLRLDPRPRRNDTVTYSATVVLLGIDGRTYSATWDGRVIREPPSLTATAETRPFRAEALVSGRTEPWVTLSVDGRAVGVDPAGRFAVTVNAGLLPSDVVVRAVDPVGHETAERLQVVGLVDYRGWPWLGIAGLVTVLVAVRMYLGTPRNRPVAAALGGDGMLEEIDGD